MSYFFTPNKESIRKPSKTISQNKNCDWVCVLCNNLNFSFRKKCNRCKTQTRTQNQNQIACTYSQYYYDDSDKQGKKDSLKKSPLSDATNLYTPQKVTPQNNKDK